MSSVDRPVFQMAQLFPDGAVLDRNGIPVSEYFVRDGKYFVSDGIDVDEAGAVERAWVEADGTIQADGRVWFAGRTSFSEVFDRFHQERGTFNDRCHQPARPEMDWGLDR